MSDKDKMMVDAMGVKVPAQYVPKYDRVRDKQVRAIHALTVKTRATLENVVKEFLERVEIIQSARLEEKGIDVAEKGNFSCTSFDNLIEVSIDQNYVIRMDDRVKTAQGMMMGYAKGLLGKLDDKGAAAALLQIIEEAFKVGSSGALSTARVLSLCRRDIKAKEWQDARDLLLASMQTEKGRAYFRVRTRPSTQHNWETIKLDLADCWPKETGNEEQGSKNREVK